ncbi:MAG: hypothetical protein JSW51_03350 [Gemmatimonadota bacterium]|nr:MAG: hypothetical protein JSW51_03350 [Gemmatimonadota bacterium]
MARDMMTKVGEFATQLEQGLGGNLVSFLLYGPAVRDEGTGDATTLLVVNDTSPSALRPIEPHVANWCKKGNPPPLIFSFREWRSSTDVFPIEIEDMREAHILIRGEDPLAEVVTTRADLRRELEREIRGKLLQLRTEFTAAASDGKALGTLLLASARTFFILFRATLRLVGEKAPQEPGALVAGIAAVSDLDATCFDWILQRMAGEKNANLTAYDPVGDRYLLQIERLAEFVDSFDVTSAESAQQQGST